MSQAVNIRKTDSPFHDPVQSYRFVSVEEKWFFMTREGSMHGPYATLSSAEVALEIYLSDLLLAESANDSSHQPLPSYSAEELSDNVTYAKHLFDGRWKN